MRALLLLALVALLSGCNGGDLFDSAPGQYQGFIIRKTSGSVDQQSLAGTIAKKSKRVLEIASGAGTYSVTARDSKNITLGTPVAGAPKFELKSVSDDCFATQGKPDQADATLCYNGADLTIDLHSLANGDALTLSLSRNTSQSPPPYMAPRPYTVAELTDRAMSENFDTPIRFERVVQAKLKMETAYLNLLPHININDVLNIAALNVLGVLKAAGDLVPFLFPTRWLQASEAESRRRADYDAWVLSKADAANIAEDLSYSVARDAAVIATIESDEAYVGNIRDKILEREHAGLLQIGSADDIRSILNSIDKGLAALRAALIDERAALAQAAGFYNSDAIESVAPVDVDVVRGVRPDDHVALDQLDATVFARSYELRQMDALIEAARIGDKERYFQWLDPSGDKDGSLGFNLGTYVGIGQSQVRELIDKRQLEVATLMQSVTHAVNGIDEAFTAHELAAEGLEIQNRRVDRHLKNLENGISFSMSDLVSALQERLKNEVELVATSYTYLAATANLNRLQLGGPYAKVATQQFANDRDRNAMK